MSVQRRLSILLRFSLLIPPIFWGYLLISNQLGADPAKELNHKIGEFVFYYLLANLLIGIVNFFSKRKDGLLRFSLQQRRFLGILSFAFLALHILMYFVMEGFEAKAWTQIVTKKYLIFGVGSTLILFLLAATSNNFSVRKMGTKNWKSLHKWVYIAAVLFSAHILSIEKTNLLFYGSILGIFWIFNFSRLIINFKKKRIQNVN